MASRCSQVASNIENLLQPLHSQKCGAGLSMQGYLEHDGHAITNLNAKDGDDNGR